MSWKAITNDLEIAPHPAFHEQPGSMSFTDPSCSLCCPNRTVLIRDSVTCLGVPRVRPVEGSNAGCDPNQETDSPEQRRRSGFCMQLASHGGSPHTGHCEECHKQVSGGPGKSVHTRWPNSAPECAVSYVVKAKEVMARVVHPTPIPTELHCQDIELSGHNDRARLLLYREPSRQGRPDVVLNSDTRRRRGQGCWRNCR